MQELLWYNCSPLCESSDQWLYDGANGDLPEEELCHMLHLPGLLLPEPLPLWQALLTSTHLYYTKKIILVYLKPKLNWPSVFF